MISYTLDMIKTKPVPICMTKYMTAHPLATAIDRIVYRSIATQMQRAFMVHEKRDYKGHRATHHKLRTSGLNWNDNIQT